MKYPYYIVPEIEEYRKLDPNSEEARKLSRFIAANIGDYASLRLVLGIDPPEFARFYPDMETATPSTMDTIDSFLDKFGGNLPHDSEPVPGFSGYVLEDIPVTDEADSEVDETEVLEDSEDTENLGNLIKNKKYLEALQLIERQNLNNPQKSIYFALQIRFIKKLMALKSYKNKTKG